MERDHKLDVLVEQYLECDDFCTEFLKGLGAKVVKRDLAGNPVERKDVYDIFLEARERARKRITSTTMRYRRLPNVLLLLVAVYKLAVKIQGFQKKCPFSQKFQYMA